jgi:hypothetical protein
MRWLVVGNQITPALSVALVRHGHTASLPVDVGIAPEATPFDILIAAHSKQLDVLTDRADLVNAPFEQQIRFDRSLVYLQLKGQDVEQDDAIDRLFARYKRLTPGRIYTLTETRVKVRQLPSNL